jgi:hypothetical protein
VNCAGWEVRIGLRNRQGTIEHVEWLDGMADIHDRGFRNNLQNYAFKRSYKVIVESEIGSKGNDRGVRQCFLAKKQVKFESNLLLRSESRY